MVYPLNILNIQHLRLEVSGQPLADWILADKSNGQLVFVNAQNTLWLVNHEELDRINEQLGQAGLLISWEKEEAKPKPKKVF